MVKHKVALCFVLAALSAASAFHDLVPEGKEVVYNYRGSIRAGTKIPKRYASELFVDAKLHLQSDGREVVGQFSDVTYKLYNGERYYGYQDVECTKEIPLPPEVHELLNAFKMTYHGNGQVKSIAMERGQKEYVSNMHRAIGTLLQLDFHKIHHTSEDAPFAFTTSEQNLYGKSLTQYNVRKSDNITIVEKKHDMESTELIYSQHRTNLEHDFCESHFDQPLFHDAQQVYKLGKVGEHVIAKHIQSTGSFRHHNFRGKSDDHYVSVKVDLHLHDIVPVEIVRSCKSEQVDYDMHYRVYDPSNTKFFDLTNGRHVEDCDKQIPEVVEKLRQMGQFLHDPIHEKDASTPAVIATLEYFDTEALEKLYNVLNEKTTEPEVVQRKIFHQLLPQVGTYYSTMLTKKLVMEKKVEDYEALDMLGMLPDFIRLPNEKLMVEMEDLLTCDHENELVRRAAVLCFSSIVRKAYKEHVSTRVHDDKPSTSHAYEHLKYHTDGHSVYNSFSSAFNLLKKKQNYFEKFTKKIFDKLETDDVSTQLLYMQALFNSKLPYITEHIKPYVTGEKCSHVSVRQWALFTAVQVSGGNSDYIFDLLWPVFSNPNEVEHLKIVAYFLLMEAHPTHTRLLNIKEHLIKCRDTELYNFHYTFVKAMSQTTDSCHKVTQLYLRQVFKNMPPPTIQGRSFYNQMDYWNPKFEFGEEISFALSSSRFSRTFRVEFATQTANKRYSTNEYVFRITGLDESILDVVTLSLKSETSLFTVDNLMKVWKSIPDMKDVEVNFEVLTNSRIVHSVYYKGHDVVKVLDFVKYLTCHDEVQNIVQVQFKEQSVLPFPTEMGLPVVHEVFWPSIRRYHLNVKKVVTEAGVTYHIDNRYYMSQRHRYGLTFYNPLGDMWHGIGKFHSYEFQLPVFADVFVNHKQGNMKVSLKWHDKDYKDSIMFKVLASRQVFVKGDDTNQLEISCPKCSKWVSALRAPIEHGQHMKRHYELEFGRQVDITYASDRYDTTLFEEWHKILLRIHEHKNYDHILEYFVLAMKDWMYQILSQPSPVTTNFTMMITPTEDCKDTHTDVSLRHKEIITQEKDQFLPGIKHNFRASATMKRKDKVIRTWDTHYNMELNCGQTFRRTTFTLTRIIPSEKDFQISLDDTKEWTFTGMSGNTTISIENYHDIDQDLIEVSYEGRQLEEQFSDYHTYYDCAPYIGLTHMDFYSRKCLAAHTSLREYIYKIHVTKWHDLAKTLYDEVKRIFKDRYITRQECDITLEGNEAYVALKYPATSETMNAMIITPHDTHYFSGLSTTTTMLAMRPDNTHHSFIHQYMHENLLMKTCVVNVHTIRPGFYDKGHVVPSNLDDKWTLVVGDKETDCQHGVYLNRIGDTKYMTLKAVHGDHSVEICPYGKHFEHFKITVDGKEVESSVDHYTGSWFTFVHREHEHIVALSTQHFHLHMEFIGDSVVIEVPKVDGYQFYGKCFK
uniref:Vitellogenin domain-containing protein n=1 Tax=Photinus pyralis TaxID=7054 RepID=A0A1Y1NJQ5_PHOPY